MSRKKRGKNTVIFDRPPVIRSAAGIVGEKEGQGPIGSYFDEIIKDPLLGMKSWEEAEAALQSKAAGLALDKIHMQPDDIDYLFAGDLLGQSIATSFGMMELQIPHFGLYGACSTMGGKFDTGRHDDRWRFCQADDGCYFQPFCQCGKAVPFSFRIWQSTFPGRHLDSDWQWSSDIGRK